MFKRARLLLLPSLLFMLVAACEAATGPDAPARTNGCIDETCNVDEPAKDAGKDARQDAQ